MTLYLIWWPRHTWEEHKAESFGDDAGRGLGAEQLALKAVRRLYPRACYGPLDGLPWAPWPEAARHCPGWEGRPVEIRCVYGGPHQGLVALLVRLAGAAPAA